MSQSGIPSTKYLHSVSIAGAGEWLHAACGVYHRVEISGTVSFARNGGNRYRIVSSLELMGLTSAQATRL